MELYLLRHAIAVERGTPGFLQDSRRPLTPQGRKKTQAAARGMQAMELSFDVILSSPYRRARETAAIVAKRYRCDRQLKFSRHLRPDGNPRLLINECLRLARTKSASRLLLVGHEPDLSRLAAKLIGGPVTLGLKLKKGALCKLAAEKLRFGVCAELEWLLTAGQLARLS